MTTIITNDRMRSIAPYLAHHGIKGQEWYHRRYQNYDGSYTEAGRLRYGIGKKRELKNNVARRKTAEKLIKYSNKASKLQQNARIKNLKNPNAQTVNVKKEQKAEELRNKQYEKAHELIGESEKLHAAIDAYDVAEDRYEAAIDSFLKDKEAYSKVVDAQIEEDRKHGFYGGIEEDFRDFYNTGEGQQTILERYEMNNPELHNLWSDAREKEKAFEETARDLYDDALSVFGNFEVDRRKILGKGPYTLSEELAEREVYETLHGKRDIAKKMVESEEARSEFDKLPKEEQNRYYAKVAEKQFEEDMASGALSELNEKRKALNMHPITKDDYIYEAINGDGNEGYNAWKEYAKDRKNREGTDKTEAPKASAKSDKPEYLDKVKTSSGSNDADAMKKKSGADFDGDIIDPKYLDKVKTSSGDTRYFYDKSELKAYKDGKSSASDKDLDNAYKKMRNSSKTDEEKDLKEHYWANARDNDRWDINFLEAVQNSVILDQNDKKSLLTEYAKYLSDPMDYWENGRDKLKEL